MRATGLILMALTTGLTISRADVIQPTVVLPPVFGAYELGGVCVSGINKCTESAVVSGFHLLNQTEQNGNELVVVGATYSADILANNGGVPGAFLGHLSLSGTAQFTYLARDPAVNPLGIFVTDLTDFDFTGALNGNTFEVKQDPAHASTGSTKIIEATFIAPILYAVSGSLEIFGEYSLNGGPFVTAPMRIATLTAVPEPGLGALMGYILAGVLGIQSRRRRKR